MPRPGRSQESPAQAFPAPSDFHHTPLPCPSLPPLPHRRGATGRPFPCWHPGPILAASQMEKAPARDRVPGHPFPFPPSSRMFPLADDARTQLSSPFPQVCRKPLPSRRRALLFQPVLSGSRSGPILSRALARGSLWGRASGAAALPARHAHRSTLRSTPTRSPRPGFCRPGCPSKPESTSYRSSGSRGVSTIRDRNRFPRPSSVCDAHLM